MSVNMTAPLPEIDVSNTRPATIANRIFDWVRGAIVQLALPPGSPLSEADIAQRFGVSRQPVREAFIKLAEAGLVEIRPQRGTFVRLISRREVENARFLREAIEVAVVRSAAERIGEKEEAELRGLLEEQRRLAASGDNVAFLRSDELFHQALSRVADCEHAWRVIEGLKAQMDRVRYLSLPQATPLTTIIDQHEKIVWALHSRDPLVAEDAMRRHLNEILVSLPKLELANAELFAS
jgi:DNA-binding GntR family transcriptional regulator